MGCEVVEDSDGTIPQQDGSTCGGVDEVALGSAEELASGVRDALASAIDGGSPHVRVFQAELCDGGALRQLYALAVARRPLAFEALRLLAYRNRIVVQQLANMGAIELLEQVLVREAASGQASGTLQASALQLLTSLLAFNLEIHPRVMHTKLIANHPGLLAAGAALELAAVMQREPDPYRRINATMAVVLLVGHEEAHPLLRMDEAGIREMLLVLACARARVMCHGYYWTCWKVCQALSRLSANEDNKQLLSREGGVAVLADVLLSEHSRKAITVKYCVEALWNLAFYEPAKQQILAHPALLDAIRSARQSDLDLVREVARGCLFTLGLGLSDASGRLAAAGAGPASPAGAPPPPVGAAARRRSSTGGVVPLVTGSQSEIWDALDNGYGCGVPPPSSPPLSTTHESVGGGDAGGPGYGQGQGQLQESGSRTLARSASGASSRRRSVSSNVPLGQGHGHSHGHGSHRNLPSQDSIGQALDGTGGEEYAASSKAHAPQHAQYRAQSRNSMCDSAAGGGVAGPGPGSLAPSFRVACGGEGPPAAHSVHWSLLGGGGGGSGSGGGAYHTSSHSGSQGGAATAGGGGSGGGSGGHIMISYEWGSQQKALMIKEALEARGLLTWMDGSTLEAMALAVEGAVAVLLCISKRYKESQACRAEAEYAYQQRKRIVPVMMERGYRPTGWLGILIGTKLYFDCSERRLIPARVMALERELGTLEAEQQQQQHELDSRPMLCSPPTSSADLAGGRGVTSLPLLPMSLLRHAGTSCSLALTAASECTVSVFGGRAGAPSEVDSAAPGSAVDLDARAVGAPGLDARAVGAPGLDVRAVGAPGLDVRAVGAATGGPRGIGCVDVSGPSQLALGALGSVLSVDGDAEAVALAYAGSAALERALAGVAEEPAMVAATDGVDTLADGEAEAGEGEAIVTVSGMVQARAQSNRRARSLRREGECVAVEKTDGTGGRGSFSGGSGGGSGSTDGNSSVSPQPGGSNGDLLSLPGGEGAAEAFMTVLHTAPPRSAPPSAHHTHVNDSSSQPSGHKQRHMAASAAVNAALAAVRWKAAAWARNRDAAAAACAGGSGGADDTEGPGAVLVTAPRGVDGDADDLVGERLAMQLSGNTQLSRRDRMAPAERSGDSVDTLAEEEEEGLREQEAQQGALPVRGFAGPGSARGGSWAGGEAGEGTLVTEEVLFPLAELRGGGSFGGRSAGRARPSGLTAALRSGSGRQLATGRQGSWRGSSAAQLSDGEVWAGIRDNSASPSGRGRGRHEWDQAGAGGGSEGGNEGGSHYEEALERPESESGHGFGELELNDEHGHRRHGAGDGALSGDGEGDEDDEEEGLLRDSTQLISAHMEAEVEVEVPSSTSTLVERWQAAQVRDWLVRIGHGGLADRFEEQGITGRALCGLMRVIKGGGGATLVRDMLRDELGVTGLAAQLEVLEELHRLFD
ncbi:hypothetical protein GPECTOR_1g629 [Gonium pectorale]|uniref:ADP-ribosyl cyclase/cyclic ADP-ribose hydrolase n=1 Tax=Gonium pectorale TaxID=33097 RepID=A0A150H4E2_GONPE|nr:hypothetical protein GPECTOR_1g629 [Gonium pectorale]|eukprot:KXZ56698.1 hypothetical protein GPECTOR_1g629 [Gonium pectorale]